MKKIHLLLFVSLFIANDAFSQDEWVHYSVGSGLSSLPTLIKTSNTGEIWFGSPEGLDGYDTLKWLNYNPTNSGIREGGVDALAIDNTGLLWMGYGLYSPSGLTVFDGSSWNGFNTDNSGLPSNHVLSISVDKDNVKWIGTDKGLVSFDGSVWSKYAFEDSTFMRYVYKSMIDQNNVKWFSWGRGLYSFQGIASFDGETWKSYTADNSGLRGNYISDMAIDHHNRKWFVYGLGKSGGATCFDDESWASFTKENSGIIDDTVLSIAIDNKNVIWFGTMSGISCRDGDRWGSYQDIFDEMGGSIGKLREINAIGIGMDNHKWFSTNSGVWRLSNETTVVDVATNDSVEPYVTCYPNPFNPFIHINFLLTHDASVSISVYSINGQKVATLVNGPMPAGMHSVTFNGTKLASGVYFYRFESAGLTKTGKMLLLK